MKMATHEHTAEVVKKLSRVEGHIRGIKKCLRMDNPVIR